MTEDKISGDAKHKKAKSSVLYELAPYSTLGIQLVLTIVVCAYGGWWLDNKFDTSPIYLIILTFFGAIAGMVSFIRTVLKRKK